MSNIVTKTLHELNQAGFEYHILQDVFKMNTLTLPEVEIILDNLKYLIDKTTPEVIILSQCVMKCHAFIKDPGSLIEIFEKNKKDAIRESAGIVLVRLNTIDLSGWYYKQLTEPEYAFYKLSLIHAIPNKMGFINNDQRLSFIKKIFDTYQTSPQLIDLFKKYGSKNDIPYLEVKANLYPDNKSIPRLIKYLTAKQA